MWWSSRKKSEAPSAPYQIGPRIHFKAAGDDPQKRQANLILARNWPAFPLVKQLFADAVAKRSNTILLDYTREAVAVRYQVDGIWHTLAPRDRPRGDAMLAVMKKLADLDVNERRRCQQGTFHLEFQGRKVDCTLTSQGVPTGERVTLKLGGKQEGLETLDQLGMRPPMLQQVKQVLNREGGAMLVVSSMPGDGLTTTWCAVLRAADRFMRDFAAVEEEKRRNPEVENVDVYTYDAEAGQTPDTILPSVILKRPEALAVPDLVNRATLERLCDEVAGEGRLVLTSVHAKESVEALLRILSLRAPAEKVAAAVTAVLYQRLVRRLCAKCKQPYRPSPDLLRTLGIPPNRAIMFYRPWQPPPPEQLVDAKGRPIQPPICPDCGGLGYRGRAAIYELLLIDDKMRQALVRRPDLQVLRRIARASRHRTIREEGIASVACGATALNELQRALKL